MRPSSHPYAQKQLKYFHYKKVLSVTGPCIQICKELVAVKMVDCCVATVNLSLSKTKHY